MAICNQFFFLLLAMAQVKNKRFVSIYLHASLGAHIPDSSDPEKLTTFYHIVLVSVRTFR